MGDIVCYVCTQVVQSHPVYCLPTFKLKPWQIDFMVNDLVTKMKPHKKGKLAFFHCKSTPVYGQPATTEMYEIYL